MTKHHRKPSSIGGNGEDRNLSKVPEKEHQAWHILFKNHTAQVIAHIINETWLDPDYEFVVRRKK